MSLRSPCPIFTLSNPTCRPSITFPLHSMISVNLTPSSELAQLSLQQTIEALRKINNSAKADRPDNDALTNQLVSEHWQPWPTLVLYLRRLTVALYIYRLPCRCRGRMIWCWQGRQNSKPRWYGRAACQLLFIHSSRSATFQIPCLCYTSRPLLHHSLHQRPRFSPRQHSRLQNYFE